jgi:hypothetical protein
LACIDGPTDPVRMRLWIARRAVNAEVASTSRMNWTAQLAPDMGMPTGFHDDPSVLLCLLNGFLDVLVRVTGHIRHTRYGQATHSPEIDLLVAICSGRALWAQRLWHAATLGTEHSQPACQLPCPASFPRESGDSDTWLDQGEGSARLGDQPSNPQASDVSSQSRQAYAHGIARLAARN